MHREHSLPTTEKQLDLHKISDLRLYELLALNAVLMDLQVYEIDKQGALTEKFKCARAKFNSISLEMNFRGRLEPHYRAAMNMDTDMPGLADQLHKMDREVIELHWQHVHPCNL